MATYQELRTRSQQVRDEQNIGGNTALRVGQLLMDIVKYFYDNDEAASEYLQQHFAMVNDGTQLLNWQQSPIVILHTMGEAFDDGDWSALSQGENYFRNGFIMEADGQGGGINGETPKANALYVNLANDTLYTWDGSSFDAITSGGGGGSISGDDILKNAYYLNGNLVLVFETESGDKTVTIPVTFDASNYVPTSRTVNGKALSGNITLSQSDIPGLVAALAGKISGIKTSDNTPLTPDSNGVVTLPPAGSTISPATATPSMDGTANVGSSAKYAREDHVHPHDTSKQDTLTFDDAPTAGSNNPVKSGGVKQAIDNKLSEVVVTEMSGAADIITIDDADLAFIDEDGNIAMQVREGHVETQNFDSRQVATNTTAIQQLQSQVNNMGSGNTDLSVKEDDDAALDFSDPAGNVVMRVTSYGHIKTKGFDSENIDMFRAMKLDQPQCICHGYGAATGTANTIPYFRNGVAKGYKFFEVDAVNCSDGVPVCTHYYETLTVYDKTTHEATTVQTTTVNGTKTIQMSSTDLVGGYTWDAAGNVPIALLSDVIWYICYFNRYPLHVDGQGLNPASRLAASQYAESLGVGKYVFHELPGGAYTSWSIPCNAIIACSTAADIQSAAASYKKADNNIIFYVNKSAASVETVTALASAAHAAGCYLMVYTYSSSELEAMRSLFKAGMDFIITSGVTNSSI